MILPLAPLSAQVVLRGTVFDSLSGRPLVGAIVQVADTARAARSGVTDSTGSYRIEGVFPGPHIGGFFHPALDSLGLPLAPIRIDVGADTEQRVDFAIPSARTIIASVCPASAIGDSLGLLLGHLFDVETASERQGTVTVLWMEIVISNGGIHQERRQYPAKTGTSGAFAFCGLPTGADLVLSAESGDAQSGVVEIRVPPSRLLVRDLWLSHADSVIAVYADSTAPDSARQLLATLRRGPSRVSGSVRTDKGKVVANADVSVPGTGLSSRTTSSGAFSIAGLPSGTQTVEVRALGFEPKRVTVDLLRDRVASVDIVLDRPVHTLDAVTIFGKAGPGIAAFDRRRRGGWGRFLTPNDIQQRNASRVTDLFRMMPGVRVVPTSGFGNTILIRNCRPTVYLNGMRMPDDAASDIDMLASPNEMTAVEVYTAAGRPAEFWGNACGSVVLWAGMMPR